jgi:hypothetical protein
VPNTLSFSRHGAFGFIGWLDDWRAAFANVRDIAQDIARWSLVRQKKTGRRQ